ncbi:MAG: cysteine desulfurase family protein [Bdellovibrionaceae bacterium]|nr:cysteine desulfurase family protein [Pseudobdellovibrionaceae bacterium]
MKPLDKNRIYLDHNATTEPRFSAKKAVKKALNYWGNPSSIHQDASKAKNLLWSARQNLSHFLNCHPLEIIFTSGASESNNYAIKGLFQVQNKTRNELIISSVEHPSVLYTADFLSQKGFKVHKIPVSKQGFLDEAFFEKHLSEKTLLVSIMSANNETGVIFPIEKWVKKIHEKGALFHSDMVQFLGKRKVDLKKLEIDLASFSAHKCYSLQGCGILYCKKGIMLESLIHGGPQERQRRAGTENLTGIVAFGSVAKEGDIILKKTQKLKSLRDNMEKYILSHLKKVEIIGHKALRLDNTSCLCISGIHGETLLMNLDLKGISVSVGSACGSGKLKSSSVLTAMGFTQKEAFSSIRISLGIETTKEQIEYFQKALVESVNRLRNLE